MGLCYFFIEIAEVYRTGADNAKVVFPLLLHHQLPPPPSPTVNMRGGRDQMKNCLLDLTS